MFIKWTRKKKSPIRETSVPYPANYLKKNFLQPRNGMVRFHTRGGRIFKADTGSVYEYHPLCKAYLYIGELKGETLENWVDDMVFSGGGLQ